MTQHSHKVLLSLHSQSFHSFYYLALLIHHLEKRKKLEGATVQFAPPPPPLPSVHAFGWGRAGTLDAAVVIPNVGRCGI